MSNYKQYTLFSKEQQEKTLSNQRLVEIMKSVAKDEFKRSERIRNLEHVKEKREQFNGKLDHIINKGE